MITRTLSCTRIAKTLLLFALGVSAPALATEPAPQTKQEISHLMSQLAASGCKFKRNGSWYDAARAVQHLNSKYEYMLKHDLLQSTDGFIRDAASASRASGKPYLVKCGDKPEVQSAVWLRQELAKLRSQPGGD